MSEVPGRSHGSGGVIRNLHLASVEVTGRDQVGGLAGRNRGRLSRIRATGEVAGGEEVGGLVGYNDRGALNAGYAAGRVAGDRYIGGLVGGNRGTVSNSFAAGGITGKEGVGGLVGGNWGRVSESHAAARVAGERAVGELVGTEGGGELMASGPTPAPERAPSGRVRPPVPRRGPRAGPAPDPSGRWQRAATPGRFPSAATPDSSPSAATRADSRGRRHCRPEKGPHRIRGLSRSGAGLPRGGCGHSPNRDRAGRRGEGSGGAPLSPIPGPPRRPGGSAMALRTTVLYGEAVPVTMTETVRFHLGDP